MRLTGGNLKGKKVSPKGLGSSSAHGTLRATGSKVREALFNIIGPQIEGAVFADLFAGSGTVGMEAMSRGVLKVYFVEPDKRRARALEELICDCGCADKAVIKNIKAGAFIDVAEREGLEIDLVFLDPPYGSEELDVTITRLGASTALADNALVIAEHSKRGETLPDDAGRLRKQKEYKYGDTILTLYRKG